MFSESCRGFAVPFRLFVLLDNLRGISATAWRCWYKCVTEKPFCFCNATERGECWLRNSEDAGRAWWAKFVFLCLISPRVEVLFLRCLVLVKLLSVYLLCKTYSAQQMILRKVPFLSPPEYHEHARQVALIINPAYVSRADRRAKQMSYKWNYSSMCS